LLFVAVKSAKRKTEKKVDCCDCFMSLQCITRL